MTSVIELELVSDWMFEIFVSETNEEIVLDLRKSGVVFDVGVIALILIYGELFFKYL